MASSFRFVPSRDGFIALRNSDGVKRECLSYAQAIVSRAESAVGGHRSARKATFNADVREGRTRCHAMAKQDGGYVANSPLRRARGF